jgi:hypothetical protein
MREVPLMPNERLHDIAERGPADVGRMAGVEARIEAASPQSGDSLRVTFAIANTAIEPVEILNPIDLLQWQLLDETGMPLELPRRVPNLRVHRPADVPWKLDSAIPIVEVRKDGERAHAASLDARTLTLGPDGELAVTFGFGVPAGDYRLTCLATIIDAADTDMSRIVRSGPVPIRFDRS